MYAIHKKIVVDDKGTPQEVIIPWAEFQMIEEALGLDLEPKVIDQLEKADADMRAGNMNAFIAMDEL